MSIWQAVAALVVLVIGLIVGDRGAKWRRRRDDDERERELQAVVERHHQEVDDETDRIDSLPVGERAAAIDDFCARVLDRWRDSRRGRN